MKIPEIANMGANVFRVNIERHCPETGELCGRIINGSGDAEFSSLSRMVILIDSLMDAGEGSSFDISRMPTDCADMEIEVLFRQNYSWQGKLRFPKQRKEAVFRSVLELIVLIETVLGG